MWSLEPIPLGGARDDDDPRSLLEGIADSPFFYGDVSPPEHHILPQTPPNLLKELKDLER
jgi:hypothetical protein